ncbi:hypothetical protein PhCBS80983_g05090 [Powellomyces hirtus]|uniref:Deoxycytidylate deaminase n=1 Tax=Powellomyces hirtus TaxID=109895 RepID=A0A507DWM0_9FUNG|nr:hypothetical protein PhCBS80983_g05090 [Powellomyces hirtus]
MLIALAGPPASGKRTVAQYLINAYGFQPVFLASDNDSAKTLEKGAPQTPFRFSTAIDLVHYVTSHWSKDFVLVSIENVSDWEPLSKRPFCLLVAVDAPLSVRFTRFRNGQSEREGEYQDSFAEFVETDESILYGTPPRSQTLETPIIDTNGMVSNGVESPAATPSPSPTPPTPPSPADRHSSLYFLMQRADTRIFNPYPRFDDLYTVLRISRLTDQERLRPSWDSYFMQLCNLAARRSNCMKRRVGCILVKERRIIATGYNGTPRGVRNCTDGGCPRCNDNAPCGSGLDVCLCLHAEENALLEAGRERVDRGGDTILYCNTCPCLGCAKKIVQVGVKEVVYSLAYGMDDMTARLLMEAGIKLRQHLPLDSDIDRLLLAADVPK